MENKTTNQINNNDVKIEPSTFEKRKFYNMKDTGNVFLLALLFPILMSLIVVMVQNIIVASSSIKPEEIINNVWYSVIVQLLNTLALVGIYLFYNMKRKISYSAVEINFKMSWKTYLLLIFIGIVSLFGLQYLISSFDQLWDVLGYNMASPIEPESVGMYFLFIFLYALLPAIAEELLFRGVILHGLRSKFNDYAAIFLSALMFALFHQNLQQLIYPFLLGSIMGLLVLRTGSLVSSMIVHFINNFLVITFAFIKHMTGFSLALPSVWWAYIVAVLLVGVLVGIIYLIDRFYFKHKSKNEPEKDNDFSFRKINIFYVSLAVAVALFMFMTIYNFVV